MKKLKWEFRKKIIRNHLNTLLKYYVVCLKIETDELDLEYYNGAINFVNDVIFEINNTNNEQDFWDFLNNQFFKFKLECTNTLILNQKMNIKGKMRVINILYNWKEKKYWM